MSKQKCREAPWLRYMVSCVVLVLIVAPMIVVLGCAQKEAPPESAIPTHFSTYTDETGLFSISYPPDWEPALSHIEDVEGAMNELLTSIKEDIPIERTRLIFFAGLPTEAGYTPQVNILVESLPGIVWTHDNMVEAEIQGLKEIVQDYHEISRVKTAVDGR